MSKPQSKSSQARKSAAKVSQSSSTKSAHEVLENLIVENECQKHFIELLQEENDKLAYTIGSRDLEVHDLQEQVADLKKGFNILSKALQDSGLQKGKLEAENGRLVTIHNELGRDYTVLQTQNVSLAKEVDSAREQLLKSDRVVQSQRKVIQDIKQMLSLQQQIMSDVAGLK